MENKTIHEDKVLRSIEATSVAELTREMIRTPTVNPPGDEIVLAKLLQRRMAELGLHAEVFPFDGNRANLYCRIPGTGRRTALVYSGHLDTVPVGTEQWPHDPFSAAVTEGRIYGRGAADMKGGIAAMIAAASAIVQSGKTLEGDLILAFTAGEEVNSVGAVRMLQDGFLEGCSALVIAEPTGLQVCPAHKGALWLEAVVKGQAAHSSSPQLGKNAIIPMAEFIQELQHLSHPHVVHPLLGEPTMNIATIQGGFKTNVVPDLCRLTIDFRTVPGQDHTQIATSVAKLLDECARKRAVDWELRMVTDRQPVATSSDDPFVRLFVDCATQILDKAPSLQGAAYFTDAAVLLPALRVPLVICGPGEASCAHQANEWVSIENLGMAAQIYALTALRRLE